MQAVDMGEGGQCFAGVVCADATPLPLLPWSGVKMPEPSRIGSTPASAGAGFGSEGTCLCATAGQRYRGSRYSFWLPGLPKLADSRPDRRLGAERIGLSMDESDQLSRPRSTPPWWLSIPRPATFQCLEAISRGRWAGEGGVLPVLLMAMAGPDGVDNGGVRAGLISMEAQSR